MSDIGKLEQRNPGRRRGGRRRGGARSRARRRARQERLDLGAAQDARRDDAGRAQGAGRRDQRAQGQGHRGARRAPRRAQERRARRAPQHRDRRRHAAGARAAGRARPHPSDQPGDRRTHRDLRRHGLRGRRRSGHRDRRLQLHQAQLPRGPSGAGDARHVLLQSEARRLAACCCARTPRRCRSRTMLSAEAADPRDHPGPHLSQRLRPDPHADVPPGRGAGDRQGLASRPPEMDPGGILQGVLRGRSA